MKAPKKTDKKSGIKKSPSKEMKGTPGKPADQAMNSRLAADDDDDDFDMPLDEIEGFDEYSTYDDDDDF